MNDPLTIALDAMGGDHGPDVVVGGAAEAVAHGLDLRLIFFGNERQIREVLNRHHGLGRISEVCHTDEAVDPNEKPSQALRRNRGSSMGLAIEAVNRGQAHVAISAGSTGALMAMAKFMLKTMPGIDRPALATVVPTRGDDCVMLDLGANVDCDANNLIQFAIMGTAFARVILGRERPRVALLNVGVEAPKGNDAVKGAEQVLARSDLPMDFVGFREGDFIATGDVDVVVTDGFSGNIALKMTEGMSRLMSDLLEGALRSSVMARLGYLLARPGLTTMRERLDPRRHNGAVMLGLNGLLVKSHGNTDIVGFAHAIEVAARMAAGDLCARIAEDLRGNAQTSSQEQVAVS